MSEQKPYILMVEDDPDIARLAAERLADFGYEIKNVASAEEARAVIKERAPVLMLLDYILPGENGLEFVESFKAAGEACPPFIVMTGHSAEEVAIAMLRAGARDYLIKGVSFFDPLKSAVKSALAELESARRLEASRLALEGSEGRYRSLFEASADGILIADLETRMFRYANPAIGRMLGYTREELLTLGVGDIHPKNDLPSVIAKFEAQARGEISVVCQPCLRKNSEIFYADVNAAKIIVDGRECIMGIFRDITAHKLADAAQSEAFEMQGALNSMLQNSLEDSALCEKLSRHLTVLLSLPWLSVQPKGAIFLMNSMGTALVLTAQQGLSPFLLKACARVPLGRCLCGKAAESGQVVESSEVGADHHTTYEGITPHGHYCAPIIAGGKKLGVLNLYLKEGVTLTDSQRRFLRSVTGIIAENILHSQTQDKFMQSQKMEAVGLLAGGVAHDFNNILTAIKGYTALVTSSLKPEDPAREDMREIMTAADRATTLTSQLLAFSRKQIMLPKVVDLNKALGDMVNMLRRIIGEDTQLSTKLFPGPCFAKVDPGQIEQVIMNLALNARDAIPKGGKIVLETEILTPAAEFFPAHPDLERGQLVCVKVLDNGCGMSADVKKHLFEPFYTTKEQGKGTGLGLSMVYGTVKQSGGEIEVETAPGKGSVFKLYFPLIEAPIPEKRPGKTDGILKSGTETVLLVDDDESLRRLCERMLRAGGYVVISAAGGKEALEAAGHHGKPVDLLLTDLVMPVMSGRELALELVRRKLAGRILYMSGYTDEAIVKHGILEPGIAFIYKPFTAEALSLKMREALDGPADQAKA